MNDSSDGTPWRDRFAKRLGVEIQATRKQRDMSAVKLSEVTAAIGVPLHRVAITRIEKGEQDVTAVELVALAVALDTDWAQWLSRATDGLEVAGTRSDRAVLRMLIDEVNEQLDTQRHNLFQAEQGPQQLNIPDRYRERLLEDAQRYRDLIKSLEVTRDRYEEDLKKLDSGDA
ncbi:helix-turn-helix domain-containing protein [Mycolicibacterium psychrotolerans]|uniref:helix-turn-helix domain-containing protein n=1 Tax=Mycolicibacterium psychrotolerans TaxID=216929 RepID=UPI0013D22D03|nr:helix-turn-helix transcriptional regulator [Mycolicibacterium psychrotolerans]